MTDFGRTTLNPFGPHIVRERPLRSQLNADLPYYNPTFSLALLEIDVEQTQVIQYYGYHEPNRREPTPSVTVNGVAPPINSIPLVARKPTELRLYVRRRTNFAYTQISILGKATISSCTTPVRYTQQPVTLFTNDEKVRLNRQCSINVILPAECCVGTVHVWLEVWNKDDPNEWGAKSLTLSFIEVPPIPVTLVRLAVDKQELPDPVQCLITMAKAVAMLPTPYVIPHVCTEYRPTYSLTSVMDWGRLLSDIWQLRQLANSTDLYVGMLPSIPKSTGVLGASTGNMTAACSVESWLILAHEIGHAFWRDHVESPDQISPPDPQYGIDNNYPTYDSLKAGAIGEFGENLYNTAALGGFSPTSYDIMTYCKELWISPYTYLALMAAMRVAWPVEGLFPAEATVKTVQMSFSVNQGGAVSLLFAGQLERTWAAFAQRGALHHTNQNSKRQAEWWVELHSADGAVLGREPAGAIIQCFGEQKLTNVADAERGFVVELLWHDEARTVVVRRGDELIERFVIAEQAPAFDAPVLDRSGKLWKLHWNSAPKGAAVKYGIRYTADEGRTWIPVPTTPGKTRQVVDPSLLPGGAHCRFQVLASADFRTAIRDSESFEVAVRPRTAVIVSPLDGAQFASGESLPMLGGGHSPDFGLAPPDEVVWRSNRDGILGSGYQFEGSELSSGTHRITLAVLDGQGGEATAVVHVHVRPPEV